MADSQPTRIAAYPVGAFVGPVMLVSGYLLCSRRFMPSSGTSDCIALGVAVALGSLFVGLLPVSLRRRLLLLLGYVPLSAVLLVYYTLLFVGVVFGDWL
jgi:hypothetical protein